jgi:hypothetical protein
VSEEVGTGCSFESSHKLSGPPSKGVFGAFGAFAEERLERTVGHLDRVEVWRLGRQIAQHCVHAFYRFAYSVDLVCRNVIHDDDVPTFEGRHQNCST